MTSATVPTVRNVRACRRSTAPMGVGPPLPRSCRPSDGPVAMRTTEPSEKTNAAASAPRVPQRCAAIAPTSGPRRKPTRIDPPSSDIPRASRSGGRTSIMNPCRATKNALEASPEASSAAASTHRS